MSNRHLLGFFNKDQFLLRNMPANSEIVLCKIALYDYVLLTGPIIMDKTVHEDCSRRR